MTKLTEHQRDNLYLTLENEQAFYKAFTGLKNPESGAARRNFVIRYAQSCCGYRISEFEDLLEAEVYFCKRYEMEVSPEAFRHHAKEAAKKVPAALADTTPIPEAVNAGAKWSDREEQALIKRFEEGTTLRSLCAIHRRNPGGILARLKKVNLIVRNPDGLPRYDKVGGGYFVYDDEVARIMTCMNANETVEEINQLIETMDKKLNLATSETKKEIPTMNIVIDSSVPVTIAAITTGGKEEVTTYIYGDNAKDVTDECIFDHIASMEKQIAKLGEIKNKPKKLTAQIEGMQKTIEQLVAIVDAR